MSEEKSNVLQQPNKLKWRDNPPRNMTRDDMVAALECANCADDYECDCWNTTCVYFGKCRACMVFHLRLKQLPTCARDAFEGLEELYLEKTSGVKPEQSE